MSNGIWDLEEHTKVKHEILKHYLEAWFPILAGGFQQMAYVDGFAGPGVYSNGQDGSPIIAIKTANNHVQKEKFKKIIFEFIENDPETVEKLRKTLEKEIPRGSLPKNFQYKVHEGKFEEKMQGIISRLKHEKNIPTFVFIDPFGYKVIPMQIIEDIMSHEHYEVLITFVSGFINRFGGLNRKAMKELFGNDSWKEVQKSEKFTYSKKNVKKFLDHYENSLRTKAKYIRSFEMINSTGNVSYHLVFCTNHLKGMEVMKRAMYKEDRTGNYSFSDRSDPKQMRLMDLDNPNYDAEVANQIFKQFKGQNVTIDEVKEFVVCDTKFLYRVGFLQELEKDRKITVDGRKRRMSYPSGSIIKFIE